MGRSIGDNTTVLRGTVLSAVQRDTDRAHYLAVVAGDKPGQRIRLGTQPVVIGRAEPSDWVLPDAEISRTHCQVCVAFDQVIVIDMQSSNGTFIEGKRLVEASELPVGARLQIGTHVIEHEWRTRQEVEESQALGQDIEKAGQYIHSLLPAPMTSGPVLSDWVHVPSPRLGGDAFGYRLFNERYYAIYMIDVSGHGAGSAMHAVSVLNVLGRGFLPTTDFCSPANVLHTLNVMFDMKAHGGLTLSAWYGVYDSHQRRMLYATAGHHPAYLVPSRRDRAIPLETDAPVIGVKPDYHFTASAVDVPPRSTLYLFSDGVFEFPTRDEDVWGLQNFAEVVLEPPVPGRPESQRLLGEVRKRLVNENFEDDFALVALSFP
jgi:serine phosphatase RsbU (regulator of sigma subunit)